MRLAVVFIPLNGVMVGISSCRPYSGSDLCAMPAVLSVPIAIGVMISTVAIGIILIQRKLKKQV